MIENKLYDDAELLHPTDEDDFDDDIDEDDDDDDIDWEEEEREALREQEEHKKETMNFNQGVFQPSNPWGTQATTQYSPWGQQVQTTWGNTQPRTTWNPTQGMTPNPWTPGITPTVAPQGTTGQQNQYVIDRKKRVVFCDLQDCLIGSLDSAGRSGVQPRGIYDIYIRRDVIDKIRCFGPTWIFVITNPSFQSGTEEEAKFTRMADYVCACTADLVGLPVANVRCVMKSGLDPYDPCTKPGTGLLEVAWRHLKGHGLKKSDAVVIGTQSGYQGQSGRDLQMATSFGVDYIDVQQLIAFYR